jgi:hypothetical protein
MRAFGLLSNRLFDIVGAGGRAVSDAVPSMASVFGDAVRQVGSAGECRMAIDEILSTPRDEAALAAAAAEVHARHSFDARARTFIADAFAILGLPSPFSMAAQPKDERLAVHIIARHSVIGPQSSAFIRLVAPLTDESVAGRLRLTLGSPEEAVPDCDVCIVQRTALPTVEAVDALVRQLGAMGAALVVDVDDAFRLIGPDHPEYDLYRHYNAAETWFSTLELAEAYAPLAPRSVIVPNAIDPRLWRDWRKPRPTPFAGPKVRMLYMGTHTHGADFALVRPALDRLFAERGDAFDVTLIGVAPDVEPAPWLHRLSPPAEAVSYPRFVRWLREQGPFDLGLAPLVDTEFNRCKSDIKALDYAALGMLPLVSDSSAYRADAALARHLILVGDEGWHDALSAVLDDRAAAGERARTLHNWLWAHRVVAKGAASLAARLEAYRR